MSGIETIDLHVAGRFLSSDRVTNLRVEGVESTAYARRHLRLAELRLNRSEGARLFGCPTHSTREVLDAFISTLPLECTFTFTYEFSDTGHFTAHAQLAARGRDEQGAAIIASDLVAGFKAMLAAAALPVVFEDKNKPCDGEWTATWMADIAPPGLQLPLKTKDHFDRNHWLPHVVTENATSNEDHLVLCEPRARKFASLDALLRGLRATAQPARLIFNFGTRTFKADELRLLMPLRYKMAMIGSLPRTDGAPPADYGEVADAADELLRSFARHGKALEISARLEAVTPLPEAIVHFVARVLWGADSASKEPPTSDRDWRRLLPIGSTLPQWIPSMALLEAIGTPATVVTPKLRTSTGALLGRTVDGDQVRLSDATRSSHCMLVGATGSGKSTLMANLALQDVRNGRGLILIDPHGDITADVLARVPFDMHHRVLTFDLADLEFAPGLNIFDIDESNREIAKAKICGELLRISNRSCILMSQRLSGRCSRRIFEMPYNYYSASTAHPLRP